MDFLAKLASKEKEVQELIQGNATMTETINQLEICVGQLLKEVRFLKAQVVKTHEGNRLAS